MDTGERTLCEVLGAGDASVMPDIIAKYENLIRHITRSRLLDKSHIDDVVQNVWMAVATHAHRFDPAKSAERTWIQTITRRQIVDRNRLTVRDKKQGEYARFMNEVRAGHGHAEFDPTHVAGLLSLCTDRERRTMILWARGMRYRCIAADLGCPEGSVKSTICRALRKIRRFVQNCV